MKNQTLPFLRAALALPIAFALQGNAQTTSFIPGPVLPGINVVPDLVKTIGPFNKVDKDIKNLYASNGLVYFVADDGTAGNQLWVSNGTTAGTVPLLSYGNVQPFDAIIPFGTRTIFRTAETAGGGSIYTTNGTTAQALNNVAYAPSFRFSTTLNGKLYFPGGRDKLLSWTLPTGGLVVPNPGGLQPGVAPTVLCTLPAPAAGTAPTFGPLVVLNGSIIFSYASAAAGAELYISTGAAGAAGTVLLKDQITGRVGSSPSNLVVFNGKVYYAAGVGSAANVELCSTNGTAAGTGLFSEIHRSTTVGSSPADLTVVNNKLYFTANDGTGKCLWVTDGTAAGTRKLATGAVADPKVSNLVALNGKLYFTADDGTGMRKIWSTAGAAAVVEPWSPSFISMDKMIVCNNKLVYILRVFLPDNLAPCSFVGAVDPSVASPAPVNITYMSPTKDFNFMAAPPELAVVGNRLYFKARFGGEGTSLWKVDL